VFLDNETRGSPGSLRPQPDGFPWLERVLTSLDNRGYSFPVLDHAHDRLRTRL